jgi:ribonucleoside-diphosphate reductase alpha chain
LRTGEFKDGTLGEIKVTVNNMGKTIQPLIHCFCVSVSMGLQGGIPLEDYVTQFEGQKFEPNGLIVGHKQIAMVNSIIDYVFRELAIHYLDRKDLIQKGK